MRDINYKNIYAELEKYLEKEKGKIFVVLKDDTFSITYNYYIKDGPYKRLYREMVFKPSSDNHLIYVYGGSEIISNPPFLKEKFYHFPEILESLLNSHLNKNFKVYNFGMEGFDVFDTKEIMKATANLKKPDLIIYFDVGIVDFDNAYLTCIKKNFYFMWNFVLSKPRLPKLLHILSDWFLRAYIEPNLINLAQELTLIDIPEKPFKKFNELILSYYKKNLYDIIQFAQSKNIPLVIMVPMGNLEEKPYGIYNITNKFYEQGIKEKNYDKRIDYLIKARDSEILTFNLGFKSCIYKFLTNLKEQNVYIFDLRQRLLDMHFEFNYKNFYDYGHMRPDVHKIVGQYLYDFLKKEKLLE